MIKVSEKVTLALGGLVAGGVVNSVNWELAPAKTTGPFINFSVSELPKTKDRVEYGVSLFLFAGSLSEVSGAMYAEVKNAMGKHGFRFAGGRSGYTDDERREAYLELNFNVTM